MSGETATLIASKLAELGPQNGDITKIDPRVKAGLFNLESHIPVVNPVDT